MTRKFARNKLTMVLLALAAVLPESSKPQFSDEREFIDEFRAFPNVDIRYVAPESGGPFDEINDPAGSEGFLPRNSRKYLLEALERATLSARADLVFAGNGG